MWRKPGLSCKVFVIGFCGKIYPLVEKGLNLCYTLSDLDAVVESAFKDREVEAYRTSVKKNLWKKRSLFRDWSYSQRRELFEKWFNACEQQQDRFRDIFLDNKSPIFVAEYRSDWIRSIRKRSRVALVTFNAELKPFDFVRIVEPFTAFQEISMFMGNLAVPLKEIPEISDQDMAIAKGFDDWSFRKLPTKKKH